MPSSPTCARSAGRRSKRTGVPQESYLHGDTLAVSEQPIGGSAPLREILLERDKQDAKWGQQNHEMPIWLAILHEETGELSEAVLHKTFGGSKSENVLNEAIQVAAVALAIVEYLMSKEKKDSGL